MIYLFLLVFTSISFAQSEYPFDGVESYRRYQAEQRQMAKALRDSDKDYYQSKIKGKKIKGKVNRSIASPEKAEGIKWEVEAVNSFYTYHFTNPENIGLRYDNKVSKDGRLINNPLYGLAIRTTVDKAAYRTNYFFGGQDSVGSPIYGYIRTTGFITPFYTYLGFAYGGYFMENKEWVKRGIGHSNGIKISERNSIVPLIGIEISQKIPLGDKIFLKINNLFTPVLSNHSIGLGIEL